MPMHDFECSQCASVREAFVKNENSTIICECGAEMTRVFLSAPSFKFQTIQNGKWVGDSAAELAKLKKKKGKAIHFGPGTTGDSSAGNPK